MRLRDMVRESIRGGSWTLLTCAVAAVLISGGSFAQESRGIGYALDNGDTNGDLRRDVSDGIYLLEHLFTGGAQPVPLALDAGDDPQVRNGDANGDGVVDIADAQRFFHWLFTGALEPSAAVDAAREGKSNGNPRVIPVQARAYGTSYEELSARWWEIFWSVPDPNIGFGEAEQSGPVWFLGGSPFGEVVERTVPMPAGKAVFLPVHIVSLFCPLPGETIDDLRAWSAEFIDIDGLELEVSVDGVLIKNLFDFRAVSPVYTVPGGGYADAIAPECVGTEGVSDGYWLLLPPLSVGVHTIEVRSIQPAFVHSVFGPFPAAVGGMDLEIEVAPVSD